MTSLKKNPETIQKMFSEVAENYDKANSVLSFGIHKLWRRKLLSLAQPQKGQSVLDCATGTGDLAILMKQAVGPTGRVVGTDFCKEMLKEAPRKAQKLKVDIQFEWADVTQLPYENDQFDFVTIAFGIRNVQDPELALREMSRVTKIGGKVFILEFGQNHWPVFSSLYNFYSATILPWLGGKITGKTEAYKYLQESSASFPCGEKFLTLMNSSGAFKQTRSFPLMGGIAYIYEGVSS